MKDLKKFFGTAGVSIAELVIALGLSGVAALYISRLGLQNVQIAQTSKSDSELSTILSDMQVKLSVKGACETNLDGIDFSTPGNKPITNFKDQRNNVLYQTGPTHLITGTRDIYINSMHFSKINDERIDLNLNFARTKDTQQSKEFTRRIPLVVEFDNSGKLVTRCNMISLSEDTGYQLDISCNGSSVILYPGDADNPDDDKCFHVGYSTEQCAAGEYAAGFEQTDVSYDGNIVPIYRPICRAMTSTLIAQTCPANRLLTGIDAAGSIICRPVTINDISSSFTGNTMQSCSSSATRSFSVSMSSPFRINVGCP